MLTIAERAVEVDEVGVVAGRGKSNVEKVWRKTHLELKNLFKTVGRWEARPTARAEDIMKALRITKNRRDAIDRKM
jgi:hypothetical protein